MDSCDIAQYVFSYLGWLLHLILSRLLNPLLSKSHIQPSCTTAYSQSNDRHESPLTVESAEKVIRSVNTRVCFCMPILLIAILSISSLRTQHFWEGQKHCIDPLASYPSLLVTICHLLISCRTILFNPPVCFAPVPKFLVLFPLIGRPYQRGVISTASWHGTLDGCLTLNVQIRIFLFFRNRLDVYYFNILYRPTNLSESVTDVDAEHNRNM